MYPGSRVSNQDITEGKLSKAQGHELVRQPIFYQRVNNSFSFKEILRARGVVQWQRTCGACVKPGYNSQN